MLTIHLDTMEGGQHLIYTSWGLLEWSSLAIFALVGSPEFTNLEITI